MMTTYILCGGESSRFDGDKARARFGDSTVVETLLRKSKGPVLVVDDPARFTWLESRVPRLVDRAPGAGPAAAIAHVIEHSRTRGLESIRVISCDMPTFEPRWWALLEAAEHRAAAFYDSKAWQPLFSVFRPQQIALEEGWEDQPAWRLLEALEAARVSPPEDFHRLVSINTKADLRRAQTLYESGDEEE